MLLSIRHLSEFTVEAEDGNVGQVQSFLFDDQNWAIRYLVVDTGKWLPGRQVLVAPAAVGMPNGLLRLVPIDLTRQQIQNSPSVDADRPVSRKQEIALASYYRWASYWDSAARNPTAGSASVLPPDIERPDDLAGRRSAESQQDNPHLRSTREIIGYRIHAAEGAIGHVDDFIVHVQDWVVRYLVGAAGRGWRQRKVLFPTDWVAKISWDSEEVFVNVTTAAVRNSPEFDPGSPVNREYEIQLYDYYGRPVYWE